MIEILEERPADVAAIRDVNKQAFGQDQEGNIVDALRANGAAMLSLVATIDDRVVGHIMFSPITVGDTLTGATCQLGSFLSRRAWVPTPFQAHCLSQ